MPADKDGRAKAKPVIRPLIGKFLDHTPYISRLRELMREAGEVPPGHFHSPVPGRPEVFAHIESMKRRKPEFPDIPFNSERQLELLKAFSEFYDDLPFPVNQDQSCRYYYNQSTYPYPDAIFLYSFLRQTTPKRIIEVGSGFSSAVILDTVDRFFASPPALTFIEPYPTRLNKLLRDVDRKRATIIEDKFQNVPLEFFKSLNAGDLLFIDSSHVLKCGSDLQFMLFDVMPYLPSGIYVHFHDVFQTFDYPENWLAQGRYWNEGYFLRAFLAHNSEWEIYFFNNYVRTHFEDFLAAKMPLCLKDIGGSLYIRRGINSLG